MHGSSLVAGALLLGSLVARPAEAALGETLVVKNAPTVTIASRAIRFRETDGVREYFGKDGKVFAVKWHRRVPPDLDALLGPYLPIYKEALSHRHPTGHAFVLVKADDLVVAKSMHARSALGSLSIPSRMPKGVTIDVLP